MAPRLDEVRQLLTKSRLDALLVTSLPNVRYLSGFSGSNGMLVLRDDETFLVTDSRYRQQALREARGIRVVVARKGLPECLVEHRLLRTRDRVGFEAAAMSYTAHERLKRTFRGISLVPTHSFLETIRSRKDEEEIAAVRRAARITDRVFKKILTMIKAGIRELDVAAEISYWHRRYGADADAFEPIIASGPRGALPHGRASDRKLRIHEMITIDMGCRVEGYHSDMTRTVSLGRPSHRMKSVYGVVLEAQMRALESARAGINADALDGIARGCIRRNGFGNCFQHSLGHGIGLEVHEQPLVSSRNPDPLPADSIITLEPGIYLPGIGGVRIEDDVVVRPGGIENLTEAPKELIEL